LNQTNSLRKRILNKETVYGTFYKLNCPDVAEMIGNAQFDFIIIDTEHANFSPYDTANIIRASDSAGLSSIVRVRAATDEDVLHALDSGADGVQIPSITSMETAKSVCRSAKYFPEGGRGLSMTQRSAMYGAWNKEQNYYSYANENSLVVVHVENCEMAAQVDELCDIPQIDVVFVGPGDLSQSLGKPGQLNDPEVVALVELVIQKVLAKGKVAGVFCGNMASVEHYRKLGVTYIAYSSDTSIVANAINSLKKDLDNLKL
jgi:2,4-dihydroxyhept-2-ene-1,7-dioic acid aldolase